MSNQKGAALVIVLALLSGSLMLGMSGMNSALIDERLAGNYRAAAQAEMNAERAASKVLEIFKDVSNNGGYSWGGTRSVESVDEGESFFDAENAGDCSGTDKCMYEFLKIGDVHWAFMKGAIVALDNDAFVAESDFIKIRFETSLTGGVNGDVSNQGVAKLLNKILESGSLVNVLDNYEFSGSQNQQAQSWVDRVSSDSTLFENPSEACLFRDALLSGEIASGLVREFGANVNQNEFSSASGKIAVVREDGFSLPNASNFSGILMVFGKDFQISGGGNIDFNGAIIHVPVDCDNEIFNTPQIDIRGGNGNFNLSAIEDILDQLDIEDESLVNGDGDVTSNNELAVSEWQWSFE